MKKGMIYKFGILAVVLFLSFSVTYAQTSDGTNPNNGLGNGNAYGTTSRFMVTPNPSASFAMVIALGEGNSVSRVAIYNGIGQLVRDNNFGDNQRVALVDVSTLSAGIYTINISNTTITESQVLGVNFPICPPYCP